MRSGMGQNTVTLKHIQTVRKANGKVLRYLRVPGKKRARLPDLPPDHPEFLRAYLALIDTVEPDSVPATGTVAALVAAFLRSDRFLSLSQGYRPTIRRHADAIRQRGARIQQEPDLGHLSPCPPLGQRGDVADADGRGLGCAAGDEFQRLGRVDGRVCVGAADQRGDPARRRRQPGRAERLAVPLAGFPDLDTDIHDARGQTAPAAVDDGRPPGHRPVAGGDVPVDDGQAAGRIGQRLGIDEAGVFQM
jgi:hypothetical protein